MTLYSDYEITKRLVVLFAFEILVNRSLVRLNKEFQC